MSFMTIKINTIFFPLIINNLIHSFKKNYNAVSSVILPNIDTYKNLSHT